MKIINGEIYLDEQGTKITLVIMSGLFITIEILKHIL